MRKLLCGIGRHQFRLRILIFFTTLLIVLLVTLIKQQNVCLASSLTVNIILALTKNQKYSWTSQLRIPNLQIIPFIADDPGALYHPPATKGREALMYLSYIYQFYDSLPDISIFAHGDDRTWHIDPIFDNSTLKAINELSLAEVVRAGYVNLRTSWWNACPDWINTTRSLEGSTGNIFFSARLHGVDRSGEKTEEPYMRAAFLENFPGKQVPEILGQPCCSQFAVSRAAIRSVPRQQYAEKIEWLVATPLSDQLTGRMWEHMWQYLFLREAVVCPSEREALCRAWDICFESQEHLAEWNRIAGQRDALRWQVSQSSIPDGTREVEKMDMKLKRLKDSALLRSSKTSRKSRCSRYPN